MKLRRREFFGRAAVAAVGAACFPRVLFGESDGVPTVVVAHGSDIGRMLAAGIERMGGWGSFVRSGKKVVVKPNSAWACGPETGANTSPLLVEQSVRACVEAGAGEVVVPENPCSPARSAFAQSGIEDAVQRGGGRMFAPSGASHFRRVAIPGGVSLKEADVVCDVMDCDCLVNMPVAKSHGGAGLTLSMKNWMGSVKDRGAWHRSDLHDCIAEFSTFLKPSLIILDAVRIMVSGGPRGPGKLVEKNQIVFGIDPVAVDAYAATLFGKQPFEIPYIRRAHDLGVGCGDLDRVKIVHLEA
jgi:uncharacterized protein (DUF362 family)